ncbi:substrate-binding domain-containing protein [Streptomyces sp. NPDC003032]
MAAAARHGLRVPADLRVVCVSEDPGYARTAPPVTTVTLDPDRTARAAVTLLVDLIEGTAATAPGPGPVAVPTELRIRASSSSPSSVRLRARHPAAG